ncbi:serine O-acetyltransferase EpsC [Pannus brasiliensis CCIBt3594]|uniref:Serine acetyltransferase n=1 Tax=Pannus brasiliensis CCIBt3594 TaxID=1427578 RepID=A0AAW9QQZ4_9CHRO
MTTRSLTPAERFEEVFLSPGRQALALHHLARALYLARLPLLPRLLSWVNRFLTGIEIHPGARIGRGVRSVHGMGVVIGETAIVGDHVTIREGVTLGGTGKETGKRHPSIGDRTVIGPGARVLGNITIGEDVYIGAGSVVLGDVPANRTAIGVPGRVIEPLVPANGDRPDDARRDWQAETIRSLFERARCLEREIESLRTGPKKSPNTARALADTVIEDFLHGAGI